MFWWLQISSSCVYCSDYEENVGYKNSCSPYGAMYYVCEPCINLQGCGFGDYCNGFYGSSSECDKYFSGCSGCAYGNGYGDNCDDGCKPNACCYLIQLAPEMDQYCAKGPFGCNFGNGFSSYSECYKGGSDTPC